MKSNFAWPAEPRDGPGGPFLFVGRITPEKGLSTILQALPEGAELIVVGDGPARYQSSGRSQERVRYAGQVGAAEVASFLTRARALVVPSLWYEGQPRVILEAFAAGVPVIASRIGGLPELVSDGVDGLLVDPADVGAWRKALAAVGDDDLSAHLGTGALATWERRFTPDHARLALERAYSEVL